MGGSHEDLRNCVTSPTRQGAKMRPASRGFVLTFANLFFSKRQFSELFSQEMSFFKLVDQTSIARRPRAAILGKDVSNSGIRGTKRPAFVISGINK